MSENIEATNGTLLLCGKLIKPGAVLRHLSYSQHAALVQLLDDVSAIAANLHAHAPQDSERQARRETIKCARTICDHLLRPEDNTDE